MRLAIYPSNRCNMACRYCMVDLNHGPAVITTHEILKDGLEWLMSHPGPTSTRNITFFGGEPLLHYNLLKGFVSYARARYSPDRLDMVIVTNGYYLDEAKASFLLEHGVNVDVSLDGAREWNDRYRIFSGAGKVGRSVFESVALRLRNIRQGLRASMVVAPDTAAAFADNVKAIHQSGFQIVGLGLNYLADWRPSSLKDLSRSLGKVKDYIAETSQKNSLSFAALYFSPSEVSRVPLMPLECDVVLGADGYFYCSHAAVTVPYEKNKHLRTGSARDGLDVERLRSVLISPLEAQREKMRKTSPPDICEDFFALMREFPGLLCAAHWTMLSRRNPVARLHNMLEAASVVHRAWLKGLPFNDWAM